MSEHTYQSVMAQLKAWGSLKLLKPATFQARLRRLSRELKTDHVLAQQLWFTGQPDAMLVASAAFDPSELTEEGVVRMVEQLAHLRVLDDLVANTLIRTPFARSLRERWLDSPTALTGRAGWTLLTHEVESGSVASAELERLLTKLEAELKSAPKPKQEAMLRCLVEIAIRHPQLKKRCLLRGERVAERKEGTGLISLYGPFRMTASTCCAG
jgi:3-methyladenine DNA glycosylase AlkD